MRRLPAYGHGFMLPAARVRGERQRSPSRTWAPLGASGANGATGYRTKCKEVTCCEARLVNPFGGLRVPKKSVWVLDRGYANFAGSPFHASPSTHSGE